MGYISCSRVNSNGEVVQKWKAPFEDVLKFAADSSVFVAFDKDFIHGMEEFLKTQPRKHSRKWKAFKKSVEAWQRDNRR